MARIHDLGSGKVLTAKKSRKKNKTNEPVLAEFKLDGGTDEMLVEQMLSCIGEDHRREGLRETPARVVKAWREWFSGYYADIPALFKTFEDGAAKADEMVLLTDIPVFSHCEHHITPIIGVAHVAYLPNKRIVGISKLVRVVDAFARRLQVQERLTAQIADCINDYLKPKGVGVIVSAEHLCMASRGVRTPGVMTTNSALRGVFKKSEVRAEFLALVDMQRRKERQ